MENNNSIKTNSVNNNNTSKESNKKRFGIDTQLMVKPFMVLKDFYEKLNKK